jgi:hypothetical protein
MLELQSGAVYLIQAFKKSHHLLGKVTCLIMITGYTNILSHAGNPWKCNNTGLLPRNTLSNKRISPEMKVQYSGGDDDLCVLKSRGHQRGLTEGLPNWNS